MSTQHRTHPAVAVTLNGLPPFVSYVESVTVHGGQVVRDQFGYALTVSVNCVRPLGYEATFSIVAGRLVAAPVWS